MLAAKHLARLVSFSVLVSMGILLAAFGLRIEALTGPIIFYMIVSVLTTSTFFMLTGMTDRTRITDPPVAPEDSPAAGSPVYMSYGVRQPSVFHEDERSRHRNSRRHGISRTHVRVLRAAGRGSSAIARLRHQVRVAFGALRESPAWCGRLRAGRSCAAVLLSGLASLIALSRVGMRLFWSVAARATPRLRMLEAAPVAALVLLCLALGVAAGPVAHYLDSTARSLHQPDTYVRTVLAARSHDVKEKP